eukprot:1956471-Rhodomonas_salina.1
MRRSSVDPAPTCLLSPPCPIPQLTTTHLTLSPGHTPHALSVPHTKRLLGTMRRTSSRYHTTLSRYRTSRASGLGYASAGKGVAKGVGGG